jgi:hypothetical protein
MTASADEAAQIKKHIANLANIERPDFGLSATMSDTTFSPVAGSRKPGGGFLITDHQIKTTDDFKQLVGFGPRALPFLLEALDNKTPTKLIQPGMIGGVHLATEMDSNPTNSIEQRALATLPHRDSFSGGKSLPTDPVKIGDVCFAIIGQIVGRSYRAIRYQPSALVIANSPIEEPVLAKAVRKIWTSTNAAHRLFESLLFDYSTEGVFNGESLDGWDIGSRLQCEAAMRLLYYFPQESAGMIAERLSQLDVRTDPEDQQHWMDRYLTNGVRAEEFIKAVVWSDTPVIRRELLSIFKRTTDLRIFLTVLPGVDVSGSELARKKLNEMAAQLPTNEYGPYGSACSALVILGEKIRLGRQAELCSIPAER